jgi:phosphatidylinositol alpha 1,6-mannosyltransferase
MTSPPRVALFCETFNETNGVALTARQLVEFARRSSRPFLAIHGGPKLERFEQGTIAHLELPRGRVSFGIESDLRYDLLLWRHASRVREELRKFRPDIIHVTSPGEFGQLGAWLASKMRIPLVASWHTNLHQFAARRMRKLLSALPGSWSKRAADWTESASLAQILRFYRIARVTLAPTREQVEWLEGQTGRRSFLMLRGVDCEAFHPKWRSVQDGVLRIGYVGRVTPEKDVRFLAEIERELVAAGHKNFSILVVGDGSERGWLERNLKHGVFTGVLRGAELAKAYANMDLFVFPSKTDTFGNVIQEAAASAVPAIVTSEGGPQYLVKDGSTGFIARDSRQFIQRVLELEADPERLNLMGAAARESIQEKSWDAAFEMTYTAYRYCLQASTAAQVAEPKQVLARPAA